MKAMTQEIQDRIIELRTTEGMGWEKVADTIDSEFEVGKPTYSQMWLTVERHILVTEHPEQVIDPATPEAIATARHEDKNSWGTIAVRCNLPESRVRKMYAEATDLDSKGQRIGQGGRFAFDDARLYAGERKATGFEMAAGQRTRPVLEDPARVRELMELPMNTLRAAAKKHGVSLPKRATKVQIAQVLARYEAKVSA